MSRRARTYESAERRWEGVGPYYAMFPTDFADEVVARYTEPGDVVLDPFAGRGTAVYSAARQGRRGVGIEINPVGWVYAKAKLHPALKGRVEKRIRELGAASRHYAEEARSASRFFKLCFAPRVRAFLLASRDRLDWRTSNVDRTTAALLMVYLHGKREASLSNQMRQTKAMAPDYSVTWWENNGLRPPRVDPVEFMVKRLEWRYAKGRPKLAPSNVYLADSARVLPQLQPVVGGNRRARVKLLFTSPPYFATTNYHYDQWLRLWLLGGAPSAKRIRGGSDLRGKFDNADRYEAMLTSVFEASADLLSKKAVVYVRTGADEATYTITRRVLREVFSHSPIRRVLRPFNGPTQTMLFGDSEAKAGEVDLVVKLK